MRTLPFLSAIAFCLFLLPACGGGGGGGGSAPGPTTVTTLSGSAYWISSSFLSPAAVPAGYSEVTGTLTFSSSSFSRTVSITNGAFSLPIYNTDGFASGLTVSGTMTVIASGRTASGPVSINTGVEQNQLEVRATTSTMTTDSLVVVSVATSAVTKTLTVKLYYYDSIGNLSELPPGAQIFILETGSTAIYQTGGTTL
ncbi:MAG: hypothetical protein PHQ23_14570, partial [Candidatus Wallbacteria bacterium]|nr:hypothetical protein [Candidatus Wallbacteria bacterium]